MLWVLCIHVAQAHCRHLAGCIIWADFDCFVWEKTPLKDDSSPCKTKKPQTAEKSLNTSLTTPRCLNLQPKQNIPTSTKGLWTCLPKSPICRGPWRSPEQVFDKAEWKINHFHVVWCWLDDEKAFLAILEEGCPGMMPIALSHTPVMPVFLGRSTVVWSFSPL